MFGAVIDCRTSPAVTRFLTDRASKQIVSISEEYTEARFCWEETNWWYLDSCPSCLFLLILACLSLTSANLLCLCSLKSTQSRLTLDVTRETSYKNHPLLCRMAYLSSQQAAVHLSSFLSPPSLPGQLNRPNNSEKYYSTLPAKTQPISTAIRLTTMASLSSMPVEILRMIFSEVVKLETPGQVKKPTADLKTISLILPERHEYQQYYLALLKHKDSKPGISSLLQCKLVCPLWHKIIVQDYQLLINKEFEFLQQARNWEKMQSLC